MEVEYDFKIVLIGDCGVGKTSIVRRYTDDTFVLDGLMPTIGVDFGRRTLEIDGSVVKLHIWDTAGQEQYNSIVSSYYRKADAIVLVYDIGSAESFGNLPKWLQEAKTYAKKTATYMLIGNKSDRRDRSITSEQGEQFARGLDVPFKETSAKESHNVDHLFLALGRILIDKKQRSLYNQELDSFTLHRPVEREQSRCWGRC